MSWSAPRTWVAGETVTATIMNTHVRDNLSALSTHAHTGVAGDGASTIGTGVTLSIAAALGLTGVLTTTQLAANTDNWAPTNGTTNTVWRVSTDASRNLTGISRSQVAGDSLILVNVGSFNLVLKHDVTSTSTNRFDLPGAVDLTLAQYQSAILVYDGVLTRWTVAGATSPSITTAQADLGANVTMTTAGTYYDGPSVSLTAGTWFIWATIVVFSGVTGDTIDAKLWDGSTKYGAASNVVTNNGVLTLLTMGHGVLSSTTTVKVSVSDSITNGPILRKDTPSSSTTPGSAIYAIKVA